MKYYYLIRLFLCTAGNKESFLQQTKVETYILSSTSGSPSHKQQAQVHMKAFGYNHRLYEQRLKACLALTRCIEWLVKLL